MDNVLMVILGLVALTALRNEIVFRIRIRAINYIYAQPDREELHDLLDRFSYDAMVFDLTRWTFADFYPEFVGEK